jgi:hypothetical protein
LEHGGLVFDDDDAGDQPTDKIANQRAVVHKQDPSRRVQRDLTVCGRIRRGWLGTTSHVNSTTSVSRLALTDESTGKQRA